METVAALVGALAGDSGTPNWRDLIAAGWQPGPAIGESCAGNGAPFWTATDEYSWRVLVVEPGFNWARLSKHFC